MSAILVGGIFDVTDAMLAHVTLERRPVCVEEGAHDFRLGVESGESARSRFSQNSHEYGLDLVIPRVRGNHTGAAECGQPLEELPARVAPLLLARARERCAASHALEAAAGTFACDQRRRVARTWSGAVIEGADNDALTAGMRNSGRGEQKCH